MIIRLETPADYRAVEELTREAFWNVYRPGCTEHFVLHRYRSNPDFLPELSLVMANDDGRITTASAAPTTAPPPTTPTARASHLATPTILFR